MEVFAYKMVRDYGFAPNPFHGVCTLATCKPGIRARASEGDLVVACGSAKNGLAERLICIMRVEGSCTFDEYWQNPRFKAKRPFFNGNQQLGYGDNIYHQDAGGGWVQERSHHSLEDGSHNPLNSAQDLQTNRVLWSTDFIYWGRQAPLIPAELRDVGGDDLYPARVRDYRRHFPPELVQAVDDWFRSIPQRGRLGRPGAWR